MQVKFDVQVFNGLCHQGRWGPLGPTKGFIISKTIKNCNIFIEILFFEENMFQLQVVLWLFQIKLHHLNFLWHISFYCIFKRASNLAMHVHTVNRNKNTVHKIDVVTSTLWIFLLNNSFTFIFGMIKFQTILIWKI